MYRSITKSTSFMLQSLSIDYSVNRHRVLEVSAVKSCSVRCAYCPQDLLNTAASARSLPSSLTPDLFVKVLSNASEHVSALHWTGYTEPCLNKYLSELVQIAHTRGYSQSISTTLVGYQEQIDFVGKTPIFNLKTLHLPDSDGMMAQGSLKVNEKYLNTLKRFLESHSSSSSNPSRLKIVCYGERMHPEVANILFQKKYKSVVSSISIINKIHTRAGTLYKHKHFSTLNRVFGLKSKSTILERLTNKFPLKILACISPLLPSFYYCSYRRVDQPVLLPSGEVNICCMDYSLSCIYGNLATETFASLRAHWNDTYLGEFASGRLAACSNCEYYKRSSPLDIVRLILQRILLGFNA